MLLTNLGLAALAWRRELDPASLARAWRRERDAPNELARLLRSYALLALEERTGARPARLRARARPCWMRRSAASTLRLPAAAALECRAQRRTNG